VDKVSDRSRTGLAYSLLFLQLLVSLGGVAWVFFQGMSASRCSPRSDFTTLYWAWVGYGVFVGVLLLVATGATILLRHQQRLVLIPPITGLTLVIAGLIVATHISRVALLF
jgi:hypothetical protein